MYLNPFLHTASPTGLRLVLVASLRNIGFQGLDHPGGVAASVEHQGANVIQPNNFNHWVGRSFVNPVAMPFV